MSYDATSTVPKASLSENSFYVGINLQSILYGIQLGLYFKTIQIFCARRRKPWRSDVFYAVFSSMTLLLITIRVATEGLYGERMWLTNRDYPGGSLAYGIAHATDVYMAVGTGAVVVLHQMTDALMIHRCRIVWDSWGAIVAPSILWLANLALGVLVSWAAITPRFKPVAGVAGKLGLAYAASSVLLNVALTCMIWYQLVRRQRRHRRLVAEEFVVESLLPYAVCGVGMVVTYGMGSEIAIAFSSVYTLAMCISSQMLVLRVAEGKAWQRERTGRSESGAVAVVHLQTLRYHTDK